MLQLVLLLTCSSTIDDPLVGNIAHQYINDRESHDRIAAEWTRRFAT